MDCRYQNVPKEDWKEIIVSVTPIDDIGEGIIPHTGLLFLLKNGKRVILEHGLKYGKKQNISEEIEVIVSARNGTFYNQWKETALPIKPSCEVTLLEVVDVGS
jgi:hypothetical protein